MKEFKTWYCYYSSRTSQHWSYMNNSHKMAAWSLSLVSLTKQFTTYFRLVQWPSDLLSAVDEFSHVPFHSGHSLWGKILLCCSSDPYSQLLPSGTCLLLILISGNTAREGVALLRQEGLPCLMVEPSAWTLNIRYLLGDHARTNTIRTSLTLDQL